MSPLVAALSLALGALTSLAVPGACIALDIDPESARRDLVSADGSLFVVGRARMPGVHWVSICREASLVNDVPLAAADAMRAADHVGWPSGEEVVGMLSAGWPWTFIELTWMRGARDEFPGDPRDNLLEAGNLADAIRRAVSHTPEPHVSLSWPQLALSALTLAVPWLIALTLAARARQSAQARTAPTSARP
jgi:hypothetical protein